MGFLQFTAFQEEATEDASLETVEAGSGQEGGQSKLQKASQNLLSHIPGEASGFYLMAADAVTDSSMSTLAIIFVLALAILIVVRWTAGASRNIMITSLLAFLIWMLVLDDGFLKQLFPDLLPDPLGLIVAVAYSTIVTALANAGKIK